MGTDPVTWRVLGYFGGTWSYRWVGASYPLQNAHKCCLQVFCTRTHLQSRRPRAVGLNHTFTSQLYCLCCCRLTSSLVYRVFFPVWCDGTCSNRLFKQVFRRRQFPNRASRFAQQKLQVQKTQGRSKCTIAQTCWTSKSSSRYIIEMKTLPCAQITKAHLY